MEAIAGDREPGNNLSGTSNGRIDETFRMRGAARLSVRGVNKARLAVTELRYDGWDFGMTDPVRNEDAFLVGLQLRPYPVHQIWVDGREMPVYNVRAGDTLFFDQRSTQAARMDVPFHSLMFYLPRRFLDELAADLGARPVHELHPKPGYPIPDPVIARIGRAIKPALDLPAEVNTLFATHLMLAFGTYICAAYGGLMVPRDRPGALSTWQARMAQELIEAHVDGGATIQDIAECCGLSASHFAHAFKTTFGVPPHRWLLRRRVERAKLLLAENRDSLAEIALACGFADQSHMVRVFRGATGVSPGAWRTQATQ